MNKEIQNQTNNTTQTIICVSGTGAIIAAFTIAYSVHQSRKNRRLVRENERLKLANDTLGKLVDITCKMALEECEPNEKEMKKESTKSSKKTESN